ncbi:hypothetical protein Scep_006858 [Stephania cephalantha]|uniref:Uncharacterized protein n=1 Tax=Stephania cephalantha TaxID=152367 RepID=A0AAP0K8R9_9MAGN
MGESKPPKTHLRPRKDVTGIAQSNITRDSNKVSPGTLTLRLISFIVVVPFCLSPQKPQKQKICVSKMGSYYKKRAKASLVRWMMHRLLKRRVLPQVLMSKVREMGMSRIIPRIFAFIAVQRQTAASRSTRPCR